MKTLEEIFRVNLIRLRGSRTQAAIAELAGIPLRSYQHVESTGAIPQGPNRTAIARALAVEEGELFVDRHRYGPRRDISAREAWEVLGKALDRMENPIPSVGASQHPSMARLIAAVEADPSIVDLLEMVVDETGPDEEKARPSRKVR